MKNNKIYIYISPVLIILILTLVFFIGMTTNSETQGGTSTKKCSECSQYLYGIANEDSAFIDYHALMCLNQSCSKYKDVVSAEEHKCRHIITSDIVVCDICERQIGTLSTYQYDVDSKSSHFRKCSCCGLELQGAHTFIKKGLNNSVHSIRCEYCYYEKSQEEHSLKWKYTEETHTIYCEEGCGYSLTTNHELPETYTEEDKEYHKKECTKGCGYVLRQEHNIKTKTTAATCTSDGKKVKTCSDCTYRKETKINKIDHDYTVSSSKAATCSKSGYKKYKCTVCGDEYTDEIKPTGKHTSDDGEITIEPTCTNQGVKTYKCTGCQMVMNTETINALNHTGGSHGNGGKCTRCNTVYQTHTVTYSESDGKEHTLICKICGEIGKEKCTWGEIKVIKEATCNQDGESEYTCTVCKTTVKLITFKTYAHIFDDGKIKEEPTCEKTGMKIYTCTICEATKPIIIPALEHTGATHANGGKCTRTGCGQVYDAHSKSTTVASYNKAKDGHTPVYKCSNTKCSETYAGTLEAHKITTYTDVKNGTHKGTCTTCSYELVELHNYVNNVCSKCNAKKEEAPAECEHTYVAKKDETKHWKECSKCKLVQENSEKNHTYEYTKGTNGKHTAKCTGCDYSKTENCTYSDNKCTKCGATKPSEQEECTHEYKYTKGSNGKHTVTCTKCKDSKTENCTYSGDKCTKCGATKPTEQEECTHEYTYTKGTNGKHTATCTKCKDSKTENCTYSENKCTKCGAEKPAEQEQCEHEWKYKIDKNYHWSVCSKCSDVKEGSKAKHEIETHKDNKDGTHSGTCTICKETITVAHAGDDKCDVCGAKIEDNSGNNGGNNNDGNDNGGNNNGGNSNGGKDDTTVKGDKIPQTGIENGGIIAIIAVVLTVGIISIKKFKKYKDIK